MTVDSLDAMIQTRDAQLAEREAMKKEAALADKAWARYARDSEATPDIEGSERSRDYHSRIADLQLIGFS